MFKLPKILSGRDRHGITDERYNELLHRFLAYQDAPGLSEEIKKQSLDVPETDARRARAAILDRLIAEYGEDQLSRVVKEMLEISREILNKVHVPVSPFGQSVTWAYWDIVKQIHLSENPGLTNEKYHVGDPFKDQDIMGDIIDRHVGWEVKDFGKVGILNYLNPDHPTYQVVKEYLDMVGTNDGGQLSSWQYTELGRAIRENLELIEEQEVVPEGGIDKIGSDSPIVEAPSPRPVESSVEKIDKVEDNETIEGDDDKIIEGLDAFGREYIDQMIKTGQGDEVFDEIESRGLNPYGVFLNLVRRGLGMLVYKNLSKLTFLSPKDIKFLKTDYGYTDSVKVTRLKALALEKIEGSQKKIKNNKKK